MMIELSQIHKMIIENGGAKSLMKDAGIHRSTARKLAKGIDFNLRVQSAIQISEYLGIDPNTVNWRA